MTERRLEDEVLICRKGVLQRHTATSLLLLAPNQPAVRLNGSATVVWSLLQTGATLRDAVVETAKVFQTEPGAVLEGVSATVDDLLEHGLVCLCP